MSHPPVTFATLPLELKSKVVELCRWQDENFQERWTSGRKGASLVQSVKSPWHGRSTFAISATCKDFNELAAQHIFRVRQSPRQVVRRS